MQTPLSRKTPTKKVYQCRYCGRIATVTFGVLPTGACPARKKPKVGFAPHSWHKIG